MGADLHLYLGPALCCGPKSQPQEVTKRGLCIRCQPLVKVVSQTLAKGAAKYCSTCGTVLIDAVTHEVGNVDRWKVVAATNDVLACVQGEGWHHHKDIYIPNVSRNPPRRFSIDEQGNAVTTFKEGQIKDELFWFSTNYIGEISIVKDIYGDDNCHLEWVMTQSWS